MGFMWSRRRGFFDNKGFLGQILILVRESTDHLRCVEVPVLADVD